MGFCPKCGAQNDDSATFCASCGASLVPGAVAAPAYDPFDHTAEFTAEDVSNNKCFALLPYLLGTLGIIICALLSKDSPFIQFHLRQAIKYVIVTTLLGICAVILIWTFIVPIAAGVCVLIIGILKIITIFQIFAGKSKEPAIIRSLGFLK